MKIDPVISEICGGRTNINPKVGRVIDLPQWGAGYTERTRNGYGAKTERTRGGYGSDTERTRADTERTAPGGAAGDSAPMAAGAAPNSSWWAANFASGELVQSSTERERLDGRSEPPPGNGEVPGPHTQRRATGHGPGADTAQVSSTGGQSFRIHITHITVTTQTTQTACTNQAGTKTTNHTGTTTDPTE